MSNIDKDDDDNGDASYSSDGEEMYSDNGDWDKNCISIFSDSDVFKDTDASLIFF